MLFSPKLKNFAVPLISLALFLAVGHLFFFSAVATANTGDVPHHDVADHQQEKDHPECPQDIHQFRLNDSDFDITDCTPAVAVAFNVPPARDTSFQIVQFVRRTTLLPQEHGTTLLI